MEIHTCSECIFSTIYPSNLRRHFKRKHENNESNIAEKDNPITPKNNPIALKNNPIALKSNLSAPKDNSSILHKNQCKKCNKVLTRPIYLIKHEIKCKGKINQLECMYCKEVFTFKNARYRHQKKCKSKKNSEIIEGNIVNNTINNITNIGTQNNNCNIINIVKYDGLATIEFDDQHITDKDLRRIFRGASTETLQVLIKYANKLLQNPKNLCVKKKYLTNSYCEVHKGDGKWEIQPDKQVFGKIAQDISISANDRLYDTDIGTDKIRSDILELTTVPVPKEVSPLYNSLKCNIRSEIINQNENNIEE